MPHIAKIISITPVTHDVRCIRLAKPDKYSFVPGQATDVAINKDGWREQKRPFTFTSLNSDPYLELTIKCYMDHGGATSEIGRLVEGDELIIDDPWGAIRYKGEGYFIAGGAGITPFMAIFRQLYQVGLIGKNKLFFSNKTVDDIIYRQELRKIFEDNVIFVVTDKPHPQHPVDFIDKRFIEARIPKFDQSQSFYVCGPEPMVEEINTILLAEGANPQSLIFEK